MNGKQLHSQVRKLPVQDQERLALRILQDLRGQDTDATIDPAWLAEAERRWRELNTGVTRGIPAASVMRSVTRQRVAL